jgi:hypothetical protein
MVSLIDNIQLALRNLRRQPVFAATVVLTLAVGLGATVPYVAVGQAPAGPVPSATAASGSAVVMVREATVTAGDARVTVSRVAATPVVVNVETNAGTFVVAGDSAAIAQWADSADALPEPSASLVKKHRATLKSWRVRAENDTATSMRFVRVPAGAPV